MVHYLGSKQKHAKGILEHVLADRKPGQAYVEPFVGGGNVLVQVPQAQGPRIANDYNKYMVALLDALGNGGFLPPRFMTYKHRVAIEASMNTAVFWVCDELNVHPKDWLALVGHTLGSITFGSIWQNTYVGAQPDGSTNPVGVTKQRQAYDACVRDAPLLAGTDFRTGSYDELVVPPESIIYCDPPYASTQGYLSDGAHIDGEEYRWRSSKFWAWACDRADEGHRVFVSEYSGPKAEAFPTHRTARHEEVLASLRALPKIMTASEIDAWRALPGNKYKKAPACDPCPGERALLNSALAENEAAEIAAREAQAARWVPVWSRDVKVNLAAIDVVELQQNSKVELLLTRK